MKTEFKVIPWLRRIREEHAREQAGMTDSEKIEADHKAASDIRDRLFPQRPTLPQRDTHPARVAESRQEFGKPA
jgi:hypothetical protein